MLAGRPHEAASNGSPRWMAAGPRLSGCTEPGLQADSPAACVAGSALGMGLDRVGDRLTSVPLSVRVSDPRSSRRTLT
jgi:hypothetical protein